MGEKPDPGNSPDFAALYGPDDDEWVLTPRLAYVLCETAWYLADEWRLVADDDYVRRHLPRIGHTVATREWRERFADCFERLGERIAAGDGESSILATCTAEELALHMILTTAWHHLADGYFDGDVLTDLPDHGDDDRDFALLHEVLFEDHDVLLLYRADLDGIEDDDLVAESNLHPRDWLRPFR